MIPKIYFFVIKYIFNSILYSEGKKNKNKNPSSYRMIS